MIYLQHAEVGQFEVCYHIGLHGVREYDTRDNATRKLTRSHLVYRRRSKREVDATRRLQSTLILPPAVTLTFDLLFPKFNQHVYKPKYIGDQSKIG